jgi:hypothetical protein
MMEFSVVDFRARLHAPVVEMDASRMTPKDNRAIFRDQENLDYALLRVEGVPGDARVGESATKRGFLPIPESGPWYREAFKAEAGLVIFQHPIGDAPGRALPPRMAWCRPANFEVNDGQTRILYHANTFPGSSGAPCLNQKLELIALHQVGTDGYNQGIPRESL